MHFWSLLVFEGQLAALGIVCTAVGILAWTSLTPAPSFHPLALRRRTFSSVRSPSLSRPARRPLLRASLIGTCGPQRQRSMDAQKSGKAKRKIAARKRKAELRSVSAALTPGAESAGPAPAGPPADRTPHPGSGADVIDFFMLLLASVLRIFGIKNGEVANDSSKGAGLEGDDVGCSPDCKRLTEENRKLREIRRLKEPYVVKALPRMDNTRTCVSQIPPLIGGVSDWQPGSCSCSGAFEVKALLRQAFSDFLKSPSGRDLNKALIQWGIHSVCELWSQKFPTVDVEAMHIFSSFERGRGFSGMVTDVMTQDCYARIKTRLLKLLLEAAKTFNPQKSRLFASRADEMTWSGSLGNQYFVLCKNIVEWNRTTFHPDLRSKDTMEQMKRLGEQGAFTVEGINVENLVTGLLLR